MTDNIDVCSHSIGILERSADGKWRNRILIKKNTPIPTKTELLLHPKLHFPIQVTEGEDEDPTYVKIVGEVTFTDPGERVLLILGCDSDGIVTLDLIGGTTKRKLGDVQIKRTSNLTEQEIQEKMQQIIGLSIENDKQEYLSLLNLPPGASVEIIREALAREIKIWTTRINSPSLELRTEAEQMLKLLAEAEIALLHKENE